MQSCSSAWAISTRPLRTTRPTWAEVCGLDLTKRTVGWEQSKMRQRNRHQVLMCGVPYHVIEDHIEKLLAAGHAVAVVEQMGEPVQGVVLRAVTRIARPEEA